MAAKIRGIKFSLLLKRNRYLSDLTKMINVTRIGEMDSKGIWRDCGTYMCYTQETHCELVQRTKGYENVTMPWNWCKK